MYKSLAVLSLISAVVANDNCQDFWKKVCASNTWKKNNDLYVKNDCSSKGQTAYCQQEADIFDAFNTGGPDETVLLIIWEANMNKAAEIAGVEKTYDLIDEAQYNDDGTIPPETDDEVEETDDDDAVDDGDDEVEEDSEEEDAGPTFEHDWDMDRCKADWTAICATESFQAVLEEGEVDDCDPTVIDDVCAAIELLSVAALAGDAEAEAQLRAADELGIALFAEHDTERTVGGIKEIVEEEEEDKTDEEVDEEKGTDGETEETKSAALMASATAFAVGTMMLY